MNAQRLLLLILLCAALAGSLPLGAERWRLIAQWQAADPREREVMLFGPYAPAVEKVRRTVPADGTILLFSGLDPALLPYALYPRRIWQPGVDPETNAVYMDLPPSPYPPRRPETFAVDWYLDWFPDNAAAGGALTFVGRAATDAGRGR